MSTAEDRPNGAILFLLRCFHFCFVDHSVFKQIFSFFFEFSYSNTVISPVDVCHASWSSHFATSSCWMTEKREFTCLNWRFEWEKDHFDVEKTTGCAWLPVVGPALSGQNGRTVGGAHLFPLKNQCSLFSPPPEIYEQFFELNTNQPRDNWFLTDWYVSVWEIPWLWLMRIHFCENLQLARRKRVLAKQFNW